jgi:hypothetical protein
MTSPTIGRLVRVDLREVWKHEAHDFTQWLVDPENLELLSEAVGIELDDPHAEVGVGPYRVDILARDVMTDRPVVIENQMESTDHKHLGQLLTYAAGHDAETAIWVAKRATDEHKSAIEWLNEHTTADVSFFLVEAQAWRIDDSVPAPVFEIIARPNNWARAQKQASSEAKNDYEPEIQAFYERLRERGTATAKNIKQWGTAPARRWYNVNIGSPVAHVVLRVTKNAKRVSVELYIRNSKELFALLETEKPTIEAELGMLLNWLELPEQKSSRIVAVREGSFDDESVADDLVVWMIETADRFALTFGRYL